MFTLRLHHPIVGQGLELKLQSHPVYRPTFKLGSHRSKLLVFPTLISAHDDTSPPTLLRWKVLETVHPIPSSITMVISRGQTHKIETYFRWSFSSQVRWSRRRFLPRTRNSSIDELDESSPSSGRDSVLMVIPAGARLIGTYLVGTVMTIGALMIVALYFRRSYKKTFLKINYSKITLLKTFAKPSSSSSCVYPQFKTTSGTRYSVRLNYLFGNDQSFSWHRRFLLCPSWKFSDETFAEACDRMMEKVACSVVNHGSDVVCADWSSRRGAS